MNKLIIVGAGGHGRVVADTVKRGGLYEQVAFLDDAAPGEAFGYTYLGKVEDFEKYVAEYDFFVAIGNNAMREKVTIELKNKGARLATIIDPSAMIGSDVEIGAGTAVLPGVVVNTGSKIGESVILNTASVLDHDCMVGDFCHVAVGVKLAGSVHVGDRVWIDAGAVVRSNVRICSNCKIEVGSAIAVDLTEAGAYTSTSAQK